MYLPNDCNTIFCCTLCAILAVHIPKSLTHQEMGTANIDFCKLHTFLKCLIYLKMLPQRDTEISNCLKHVLFKFNNSSFLCCF